MNRIFQVEPSISSDDIEAVNNYISSGSWITEHKLTEDLENQIKQYLDRKYAVAVPNGTIAIYLSLLAAGVKENMKVVVPNVTMIATINAVLWAKAEPILVDVDESLCLSYEKLMMIDEEFDCLIFVPLNIISPPLSVAVFKSVFCKSSVTVSSPVASLAPLLVVSNFLLPSWYNSAAPSDIPLKYFSADEF